MHLDSKMVTIVKIFVLVTFVTRTSKMYTQQESPISHSFHSSNHVVLKSLDNLDVVVWMKMAPRGS